MCEKLQYLIGVPSQYIDNYDTLNKGLMAETRKLCSLRSVIIANFTDINEQFRNRMPLEEIPQTARLVADLAKYKLAIQNKSSLSRNIIELNQWIDERMEKIALGFKGVPQNWICELFHMPNGDTIDGVKTAVRRYRQFKNYYPYQKYISWSFAETPDDVRTKNIFGNDKDLMNILQNAHQSKSPKLLQFIKNAAKLTVIVDCENSNAQRLYSAIEPVGAYINKVILVDDEHTNAIWDEVAHEFREAGIAVEHDQLPRLKEEKSLVDLRMVAKTCEEFYKNHVEHFILASSDSDIWALINSLPDANIMVLAEKCKCGDVLIDALTQNNIQRIFMEDVADDSTDLMDRIMRRQIESMMSKCHIDIKRLVINAAHHLNLYLEKDVIDKYTSDILEEVCIKKDDGKILLSVEE